MIKTVLLFFTLFLLLGCSSKSEKEFISIYNKEKINSKALQKTEKIQLYDENSISNVLLTATYITRINHSSKLKEDEVFVVGLYVENNETEDITLEHFSMKLNSKPTKSIHVLKEDSKLLKTIPFRVSWIEYYLVHFPHDPSKKLKLDINHIFYGKGEVNFAKVAKYILQK